MVRSTNLILFWSLLAICVLSAPVDDDDDELTPEQEAIYNQFRLFKAMEPIGLYKLKWPKRLLANEVVVPYEIRESDFAQEAIDNFLASLQDIANKTCVRFVERNPNKHVDYIFVHDSGEGKCSSKVGRVGGKQPLKLRSDCMLTRKKCVHEMIHALGFHHMHQRFDRDEALIIHFENVLDDKLRSFEKLDYEWEAYGTPYDLLSAMHYAKTGFSKNGEITMETIDPTYQDEIGTQYTLSDADATRINKMYRCGLGYI